MDGNYAPFGYIVEGWDTAIKLRPGDVIEQTTVDDWGLANLVQGKQIAFKGSSDTTPPQHNAIIVLTSRPPQSSRSHLN